MKSKRATIVAVYDSITPPTESQTSGNIAFNVYFDVSLRCSFNVDFNVWLRCRDTLGDLHNPSPQWIVIHDIRCTRIPRTKMIRDTQRLGRSIEAHSDCSLRNVQKTEEWLPALLIQLRTQGAPSTEGNAVGEGASRRGFTRIPAYEVQDFQSRRRSR